jgi:hypothetical protein
VRAQPNVNAKFSRPPASAVTVALLAAPAAGHLLGYLFPTLRHVGDRSWPVHARFHAFQSLLFTVGSDTTVLFLVFGPLRRRAGWVRWPLAIYFVSVQGGYFVALGALPSGRPRGLHYHIAFALSAALFGSGVVRSWHELQQGVAAESLVTGRGRRKPLTQGWTTRAHS